MTLEQLLPLITGSGGALVVLAWALYKFQRGDWVAKSTLDEMRHQRDRALDLLEKATGGAEAITAAVMERNKLAASLRTLREELQDTEDRLTRRRTGRQESD